MFTLQPLPYQPTALEPYISAKTLEFHHGKHLAGYVNKLNELLAPHEFFLNYSIEELVQNLDKVPEDIRQAVTNNAGQVFNHNLYFESLVPESEQSFGESEAFNKALDGFGSYEQFQKLWTDAGVGQFGSGWVWLVANADGSLSIEKSGNADSPLMHGKKPILTMDVWEHAYYLDYQNLRPKYIENFFKVINWKEVSRKYDLSFTA
jgi:superoxide dismutase, Fe-Mn family